MRREGRTHTFAGVEQARGKWQTLAPTAKIADRKLIVHTKFKEPEPYQIFEKLQSRSFVEHRSSRKYAGVNLTSSE